MCEEHLVREELAVQLETSYGQLQDQLRGFCAKPWIWSFSSSPCLFIKGLD